MLGYGLAVHRAGESSEPHSWPPQCCVPAFLWRSVVWLCNDSSIDTEANRREVASILEVTADMREPNPWRFPTSEISEQWGVPPSRALSRFHDIAAIARPAKGLVLRVLRANEVPFALYEDEILNAVHAHAVVGIGYDAGRAAEQHGSLRPSKRAHHLVRLSPLGPEAAATDTVLSGAFGLDYRGLVRVFDDSGELADGATVMSWPILLESFLSINGALWTVGFEE